MDIPVIRGDGIHDDAEGILAAIAGRPFVCDGCDVRRTEDGLHFGAGTYRHTATIMLPTGLRLLGEPKLLYQFDATTPRFPGSETLSRNAGNSSDTNRGPSNGSSRAKGRRK